MPKYVIEREIPGAGNLSDTELKEISQKSLSVLSSPWWNHIFLSGGVCI
jgi:hypothetical protein